MKTILLLLAISIIAIMAAYAAILLARVHKQKKQLEQARQARYQHITDSIDVIARAMLAKQCDPSEGVLRLKPLLEVLGLKLSAYPAMWALYQVVEDMPILEQRKALKRNERMRLDLTREAAEVDYAEAITLECRQLLIELAKSKNA